MGGDEEDPGGEKPDRLKVDQFGVVIGEATEHNPVHKRPELPAPDWYVGVLLPGRAPGCQLRGVSVGGPCLSLWTRLNVPESRASSSRTCRPAVRAYM